MVGQDIWWRWARAKRTKYQTNVPIDDAAKYET